ncbi:MAG: regulator protein domain-like protein [Ramlibacter sp.]|nr:regulator protein domain-like protein [Ramlibacter sp.]
MSFAFDSASRFPGDRQPMSTPGEGRSLAGLVRRLVARWSGASSAPGAAVHGIQPNWEHETQAMVTTGDQMLLRARRDNFALSVAVFELTDLPELKSVFGSQAAQQVIARITTKFQRMAPGRGLVVRTGPTVFTVLLPGFGRDRALAVIRSVMGHPCCIELEGSHEEIVLVPEFMVQTVRGDTASIGDVYAGLRRDIARAHGLEEKRRRYLQRERESHTRPMELQPELASSLTAPPEREYHNAAATIPMPLANKAR